MKIALYDRNGYPSVWTEQSAVYLKNNTSYVRVSEWVDVEFPRLPPESLVGEKLAAVDAEEQAIRERFAAELSRLNEKRSHLSPEEVNS